MIGLNSCHFLRPTDPGYLYCHPPAKAKEPYGSCGDCHCINGDKPCPSDKKKIPLTNVPDDWLQQLKNMDATNPYEMICNPYNTKNAIKEGLCTGEYSFSYKLLPLMFAILTDATEPKQLEEQLDLWETAACGQFLKKMCILYLL